MGNIVDYSKISFLNYQIGVMPPTYPDLWQATLNSFPGSGFTPSFSGSDDVMRFGYNVLPGGGRYDTDEPSFFLSFESKWYANGLPADGVHEFHLEGNCLDGTKHRSISVLIPRAGIADRATGSAGTFNVDIFTLSDFDYSQKMKFDWTTDEVSVFSSVYFAFAVNNTIVGKQLNAAGNAYINLPYIDSSDRLAIAGPAQVSTAGTHSLTTFFNVACINPVGGTGTIVGATQSTSVAGVMNAFSGQVVSTVQGRISLSNSGSGGTANAEFYASSTNGDSNIRLTNGTQNWVFGLDNSTTNDDWVLSRGTSLLGTNNCIVVNGSSGNVTITSGLFGTSSSNNVAFWGATPTTQPTAVADASGGATVDTEARTALNSLLAKLRAIGIIAA